MQNILPEKKFMEYKKTNVILYLIKSMLVIYSHINLHQKNLELLAFPQKY